MMMMIVVIVVIVVMSGGDGGEAISCSNDHIYCIYLSFAVFGREILANFLHARI